MNTLIINLFPLWAILLSAVAYIFPQYFIDLKPAIIPLLGLIMFSMGMTLTWQQFKSLLKNPLIIAIGVAIQFICMPFYAWALAILLELPKPFLIGMVLVGSSAGGTASNVICYLARGNVALSILMTMASTLCAVVLMPAIAHLYLHQTVPVPVASMMQSVLTIVLIPVITGTALNTYFGKTISKLHAYLPLLSCLAIILIIAIIAALNQDNLRQLQIPLLTAVIVHNLLGLATGYLIPWLLKYNGQTCTTIAIEVGMQNSGLSVALAIKYFSSMAALPGALFSIWHNISGSLLAVYWRKQKRSE